MHKLSSSVLTSSLDLPLAKIIHSVSNTNVTKCFELFVAREIDLFEAKVEYEMDSKLSSIIAGNESELSDWYSETMQDRDVSAVATYLPGITSLDTTVRMESGDVPFIVKSSFGSRNI